MHNTKFIRQYIDNYLNKLKVNNSPNIVVSKTFKIENINFIEYGHIHFEKISLEAIEMDRNCDKFRYKTTYQCYNQ